MTPLRRSILLLLLFLGVTSTPSAKATTLRFLSDLNIPSGTRYGETDFGGLSALTYDPITAMLFALSDDRSEHQSSRYYSVSVSVAPGSLIFQPTGITTLKRPDDSPFPKGLLDPEGMALMSGGHAFISSEGNGWLQPRVMPEILEIDSSGKVLRSLEIPERFLPEAQGKQTKGVVDNCAFESLTLSPLQTSLFTATECPLMQDDTPADFNKGGLSRILQFQIEGDERNAVTGYLYPTEPNWKPEGADRDLRSGISDLLALSETELLVLERGAAGVGENVFNRIRIFKATLGESSTTVRKELVLDLDAILPQLDPRWPTLDNIEGITFGPTLPSGNRTLLMISDNNFSPNQRTQVLAFEVVD